MVGVFAIFATLPIIDMKEMGIGLAAAVLIDATIVRAVLLPATMKLLGDWNWYLPTWLEWLPRLEHHGETAAGPGARRRLTCRADRFEQPQTNSHIRRHRIRAAALGPDLVRRRAHTKLACLHALGRRRSHRSRRSGDTRDAGSPRPDVSQRRAPRS